MTLSFRFVICMYLAISGNCHIESSNRRLNFEDLFLQKFLLNYGFCFKAMIFRDKDILQLNLPPNFACNWVKKALLADRIFLKIGEKLEELQFCQHLVKGEEFKSLDLKEA